MAAGLAIGTRIREQWEVLRKLGEGAYGVVYEVVSLRNGGERAALKLEPIACNKDDEILKMEVHVLRKLQTSKHACRLLMAGKIPNYNFLVMTLLGRALGDLRRQTPRNRMTTSTTVRLGIQCLQSLRDLHDIGFVHRDVKPSNFAMGHGGVDRRTVFLLDFGLARQILFQKDREWILREPRTDVAFRGTVRYCSVNVHERLEQGRHDDLWSLFYMLVELVDGSLPWCKKNRKETHDLKKNMSEDALLRDCPREFVNIYRYLAELSYNRKPHYDQIREQLETTMKRRGIVDGQPYDWEIGGRFAQAFSDDITTEESRTEEADGGERETTEESNSLVEADSDALSAESCDSSNTKYRPGQQLRRVQERQQHARRRRRFPVSQTDSYSTVCVQILVIQSNLLESQHHQ